MVSAWSIGTSKRSTDWKNSSHYAPGPGAYTPGKRPRNIPPSWKIGTEGRGRNNRAETPGPGTYKNQEFVTKEGPKYPFGLKTSVKEFEKTPGPGAYDPRDTYHTQPPSFSMRMKASASELIKTPGPGTYEFRSTVKDVPSSKIGNAKRDDFYKTESNFTPGPGNYGVRTQPGDGPRYGFGTQGRDGSRSAKFVPGPGAYNAKSMFEGEQKSAGWTLVPRRPNSATTGSFKVPGPGSYTPEVNKTRAPTYRIGSAHRLGLAQEAVKVPGPGAYQPGISGQTAPSYRIGSATRNPLSETLKVPGPGTYNHRPSTGDGPKYGMTPKRDDITRKVLMSNPGPGTYSPEVKLAKERPPSHMVGTSSRPDFYHQGKAPGPGQYNIRDKEKGPHWGFGSEQRAQSAKNLEDPGPGHYEIPTMIADVPKYLIADAPSKKYLKMTMH